MIKETETRRSCKNKKGETRYFFNGVWQQKRESNNEEGGQRERERQEDTYKGEET